MIKIDKNVPFGNAAKYRRKYPWDDMIVGDSFAIHDPTHNSACYNIAKQASIRYAPKKFKGAKDSEGKQRVWRME